MPNATGSASLTSQLDALHEKYRVQNRVTPKRDWYRIEAKADNTEVWIYDEIGWFGVTASEFVEQITAIDTPTITLRLNSPGGEVFDGIAIYSALRQHTAAVHVVIDSLAASIASVIAMAGDTVTITPNGMMMVHDGLGLAVGNAQDHREMADLLDKVSDNIASVYAERTGGTAEEWRDTMRAEQWYSADEAVEAGLADRVGRSVEEPVAAEFDISVFAGIAVDDPPTPDPDPEPPAFNADLFRDAIREAVST